eukprot:CAMPEP_0181295014 /NCGR_PEP_ID=MMETSP1101-20121128/3913_1 /TAXON_ID=46948 /ORGANISM="Rhodomonas abbreviata, Strain Caron Lab Isolate" /LENGTH=165 /DNA_ID=CAMNT_0023399721 /DNA_START=200 /DNA_END=697 /DNA_ORIENTATION=+
MLVLMANVFAPALGFGISTPGIRLGIHLQAVCRTQRLPAPMECAKGMPDEAVEQAVTPLTGERLQKALDYERLFSERSMTSDMRKFNVEKVTQGKPPLLAESRLAKASRYAALFEEKGERGVQRAIRVELQIAKEEVLFKQVYSTESKDESAPLLREENRADRHE